MKRINYLPENLYEMKVEEVKTLLDEAKKEPKGFTIGLVKQVLSNRLEYLMEKNNVSENMS